MLISRRKEGEAVLIGEDVEIRLIGVRKKKVILGIIAPRDMRISATKLSAAELENTLAAANSIDLADLIQTTVSEQEQVLFLLEASLTLPKSDTVRPISHTENQHE
jgi:carbon storage regulator